MEVVDELTVLVWAPRGRDANLAAQLLERNGLVAKACETVEDIGRFAVQAGCAVLTEEALHASHRDALQKAFASQPAWSDFPVILFAPRGAGNVSDVIRIAGVLGNVTVLERPVQSRTLVSAVVSALRGRRRQYEGRAAIQRRDEFLAMLGHELRNPLAAIVLAVDALHREVGDLAERPRTILERQSQHLARLVEDLLDVARVTTGKVTLQPAPIELRELLARCLQSVEGQARARSTQITLKSGASAIVDGDPVRLEEVFANLLSNAIKYSPVSSQVDVELRVANNRCTVDVIDRGIGIAPEMLPRVFDLFAQADATLDRSAGGLGIGLTVVKALVELHRGSVTASSQGKGKGSRFRVDLPLVDVEPEAVHAVTGPQSVVGLRVLVVEDNPDLLELTCEALTIAGCSVMRAIDGPSGFDLIQTHEFDVAFIDIGLPGIDGYELVRRARANGRVPRMIAMSGYGQERDRERALAAGFDLHLTKPVPVLEMLRAVRR
ncbi:MAG: hybrid sensor histidine kinase/response regulator [Myxococcota bacterium]|nr:hybrid sensor histidine kinase/response regulator [Myxococcota bacterium]